MPRLLSVSPPIQACVASSQARSRGPMPLLIACARVRYLAPSARPSTEFIDSARLAASTGSSAHVSSLSAAAMKRSKRLPKTSHSPRRKSNASMASASALATSSP
jgi:hypothetical protein